MEVVIPLVVYLFVSCIVSLVSAFCLHLADTGSPLRRILYAVITLIPLSFAWFANWPGVDSFHQFLPNEPWNCVASIGGAFFGYVIYMLKRMNDTMK